MGIFKKLIVDVKAMEKASAGTRPDTIIDGQVIEREVVNYFRKIAVDAIEESNIVTSQ